MKRRWILAVAGAALASCSSEPPSLEPLPGVTGNAAAAARINGIVRGDQSLQSSPAVDEGRPAAFQTPRLPAGAAGGGDVTLDFADTDIREIVKQVLGGMLKINYTIDPAVHGTASITTSQPLPRSELLTTLEALLNQNGATLVQTGTLYRVLPSALALAQPTLSQGGASGAQVVTLRYAAAADLERVLTPFLGESARIQSDPTHNAIIVTGDASARATIVSLIHAFDVDLLAGQSYALFPVTSGEPAKVAEELQKAFQTEGNAALAANLKIVPMDRVNAVLIVAPQPRYIQDARRLFRLIDRARSETERSWHVYYVQNGQSTDLANLLQRAFTPRSVTAQPEAPGSTAPGQEQTGFNSGQGTAGGAGGTGGTAGPTSGFNSSAQTGSTGMPAGGSAGQTQGGGQQTSVGGSDQNSSAATESLSQGGEEGGGGETNTIRILSNKTNNALMIYATPAEESTIEAMLHKVDIVPLQVRIDATIAEVTLNDNLKYGTQFFLDYGGVQGLLSASANVTGKSNLGGGGQSDPGFNITHIGQRAGVVLSALADVADVRVLSSPQLLVLDNQPARLQVGSSVPYLSQSSQSTITTGAPIVNSVDYRETGVILEVVPRVNTGGLVTLDVSQEVSQVQPVQNPQINSPTFSERKIRSRIVVQDGQTVGLAGLIGDNVSRENSGIPFLKDIPILGTLFSTQDNGRQRTELLVLITPHVLQDQRDALALTEDMREKLFNAGLVPQQTQILPLQGSPNPNAKLSR
jgi:general secretion pathway protein D